MESLTWLIGSYFSAGMLLQDTAATPPTALKLPKPEFVDCCLRSSSCSSTKKVPYSVTFLGKSGVLKEVLEHARLERRGVLASKECGKLIFRDDLQEVFLEVRPIDSDSFNRFFAEESFCNLPEHVKDKGGVHDDDFMAYLRVVIGRYFRGDLSDLIHLISFGHHCTEIQTIEVHYCEHLLDMLTMFLREVGIDRMDHSLEAVDEIVYHKLRVEDLGYQNLPS